MRHNQFYFDYATPWTEDINQSYIRRSENILNIERFMYVQFNLRPVFRDSFLSNSSELIKFCYPINSLTLSWRRPASYRNQSIDLPSKSMGWFLYDTEQTMGWFLYDVSLRHERVKKTYNFLMISGRIGFN